MRPDINRKNQGIGGNPSQSTERLGVVAPSYVQARQTDPSGIMNALGNYGARKQREQDILSDKMARDAAKAAEEAQKEKDELDAARGRNDAVSRTVDEDEMAVNKVYMENVQVGYAEGAGFEFIAKATQEVDAVLESGMSLQEWQNAKVQEYVGENEGLGAKALAAQTGFINQFLQQTNSIYASRQKDELDKQATLVFNNLLAKGLRSGDVSMEGLARLEQRGPGLGMSPDEITSQVGKTIYDQYRATGKEEYYKLAEQRGLLDTAEFGADFLTQRRINDEKRAADAAAKKTQDTLKVMQINMKFTQDAALGNLDLMEVRDAADAGWISQATAAGYGVKAINADMARAKEAEKEADTAAKEAEIVDLVTNAFGGGEDAIAMLDAQRPELQERLTKYANKKYATDFQAVVQAHTLPDGPEKQAALQTASNNLTASMKQAHRANRLPSLLQTTIGNVSLSSPQRFAQMSEVYETMKASGLGEFVRDNIPVGAYTKLENYSDLAVTLGPEEAMRRMVDGSRKIEDAREMVGGMRHRELAPVIKKLSAKFDNADVGVIEDAVRQVALAAVTDGADAETAAKLAESYFNDAFTTIDYAPVPRSHMAGVDEDSFKENTPAYVESKLLPEIQKIANINSVRLQYLKDRPGYFQLRSEDIGGGTVTRADGTPWVVNARTMIEEGAAVRAANRKKYAAQYDVGIQPK